MKCICSEPFREVNLPVITSLCSCADFLFTGPTCGIRADLDEPTRATFPSSPWESLSESNLAKTKSDLNTQLTQKLCEIFQLGH